MQSTKYNKDRPLMRARALAGLDWMRAELDDRPIRIAIIGYCFGGRGASARAYRRAGGRDDFSIHGSFRDFTPGAAKNIKGRVLILHGAEDPFAPLSKVTSWSRNCARPRSIGN